MWRNLVTWRNKKQIVVAQNSAKAEFCAIAHGICKGMWLKQLLLELQIAVDDPINMLCDNQAAISIVKNPVYHDWTKCVEIDRQFIKEKIEGGTVNISYIPTTLQIADILIKALPKTEFEVMRFKLSLHNIYSST